MNANGRLFDVGIYARLSVDTHNDKAQSIDTQVSIAKEYLNCCNENEFGDVFTLAQVYVDLGKSGQNFQRPGFMRLMQDIRARRINCVVVKDFSRFGRDYLETGEYLEKIFPMLGVRFIAVTDGYDSFANSCDTASLGMQLKNLVNDLYAKDIARRVRIAKRQKKEQGGYVGGVAPYGLRLLHQGGMRVLEADPIGAPIVRDIFERYARGESLNAIIRRLYEKGVHPPTQARRSGCYQQKEEEVLKWNKMAVKYILENPLYADLTMQVITAHVAELVAKRRLDTQGKKELSERNTPGMTSKTNVTSNSDEESADQEHHVTKRHLKNQTRLLERKYREQKQLRQESDVVHRKTQMT
ncbi:MAG: recombinase family protein [Clostridium sp.]|nr:recombinase family protein [Clostridium sp.]